MNLSVVIPLFNEEESLPELIEWIDRVCSANELNYEAILIDDGSNDNSWTVIENLSEQYSTIRAVKFQRNYGKSAALHVGFGKANGDVVITMDADLQDSPDEIPELYNMISKDGYDIVSGWKQKRHDPITKTIPTKLYNYVARKVSRIDLHDFNCGLKSYDKKVVKSIEVYGEMHRYIPIIAKWAGFTKITEKVVKHQARKYGYTKFGLERFVFGFLDLISISFMSRFAKRPMHFFGTVGVLSFFIGFLLALFLGIEKLYYLNSHIDAQLVTNSPFFYISLTLMILGTQLFLAGFLAELISRSSSDRNLYLIDEELNSKNKL